MSSADVYKKDPKTILFWTPYYLRADFNFGYGRDPFVAAGCRVSNCRTTSNRSELSRSDAVIFHALQLKKDDLPSIRLPNQRYIYYLVETMPDSIKSPCIGTCLPAHFFNWTMTHRRDSDVYFAEPYGAIEVQYWKLPSHMPGDLASSQMPPDPAVLLSSAASRLVNRTKMVAWFNSHCQTHSKREDYVAKLSQFVQV